MTQIIVITGASSGFRVHIDPSRDGDEVVSGVADRIRAELLRRIGVADLLHPTA